MTGLLSNVTAPVRANALPFSTAPVVLVMDASAMMVPWNMVLVPSVAELPTCQNTLWELAPLMRMMWLLPAAVVKVDCIWKIHTAFGLPPPSSVRLPVIPSEGCAVVVLYRGGKSLPTDVRGQHGSPGCACCVIVSRCQITLCGLGNCITRMFCACECPRREADD